MMSRSLCAFNGLVRYHLAYAVMLVRCGLIPPPSGRALLQALRELKVRGPAVLCLDPARYEELQPAMEAWLIRRAGTERGGQLNAGRSRQECQMVAEQITLRDALLSLLSGIMGLGVRCDRPGAAGDSQEWRGVLKHMPRLLNSYLEVNRSRAGIGSVVPTSLPIRRRVLASLLGFRGCVANSMYGYSAFDIEITLLNALKLLAADLHRFAVASRTSGRAPTDASWHLAQTMREAQRLYLTASNLYLDTTPMIRGASSFCTYDCLLILERIAAGLALLARETPLPFSRRSRRAPRVRSLLFRTLMSRVSAERCRVRRAAVELKCQIDAATSCLTRQGSTRPGAI
jgi:hypothetical protein